MTDNRYACPRLPLCAAAVLVSHRLFELTNTLKNAAVPHNDNTRLLRNIIMMSALGAALYGIVATAYVTSKW